MKKFFTKLSLEIILKKVEKVGEWKEISQKDFLKLVNESKELGLIDELEASKYKWRAFDY